MYIQLCSNIFDCLNFIMAKIEIQLHSMANNFILLYVLYLIWHKTAVGSESLYHWQIGHYHTIRARHTLNSMDTHKLYLWQFVLLLFNISIRFVCLVVVGIRLQRGALSIPRVFECFFFVFFSVTGDNMAGYDSLLVVLFGLNGIELVVVMMMMIVEFRLRRAGG